MSKLNAVFYKILFKLTVKNKLKRKVLYRTLSKVGIKKYYELKDLVQKEAETPPKCKYQFSIVCIAKNEGPYFREWVEYHKLLGFEHFYVYNNETEDNTKELLASDINKGLITWIDYPGKRKTLQDDAYNDAVARFKDETRYMCMLDLDEFIVLHEKKNIKDFMEDFKDCAQLSMYWMLYGSSNHKKKPEGLVIENFKSHAEKVCATTKSIFNPRVTTECGAHWMYVCGPWVDENHEEFGKSKHYTSKKCQVNHYAIKSEEEFYIKKVARGDVINDQFTITENLKKYWDRFDHNEVSDDLMCPYAEQIKQIMKHKH